MVALNDQNIQALFGVEDAENEDPDRLKQYFLRNSAYENLVIGLPIRVLIGHKGVGKSALLKVAFMEDQSKGQLAVWLQPDDLRTIAESKNSDINALIREWKDGVINVIFKKISKKYLSRVEGDSKMLTNAASLIPSVVDLFKNRYSEITESIAKTTIDNFQRDKNITVYIDDLDRGWEAQHADIKRISALINAVRDLAGHRRNIKFRLGLRSDVYFLVRTSDESTDKIEQNIIWLTWTNHEILSIMAKRIETFFERNIDDEELRKIDQRQLAKYLHPVIEPRYKGAGKWGNVPIHRILLSLTRKRPRDLVKILSGSAREAHKNGQEIIRTVDLRNTFESYSGERLQDIINEFRSELPDIERLLYGMRPTKKERRTSENYTYSNDRILVKLRNIISQGTFKFTNGHDVTPKSLAEFLYKTDFITARRDDDRYVTRRYFDQSRHLQNQFVDFGFHWEVHPAYRWALQPGDMDTIFRQLDLE